MVSVISHWCRGQSLSRLLISELSEERLCPKHRCCSKRHSGNLWAACESALTCCFWTSLTASSILLLARYLAFCRPSDVSHCCLPLRILALPLFWDLLSPLNFCEEQVLAWFLCSSALFIYCACGPQQPLFLIEAVTLSAPINPKLINLSAFFSVLVHLQLGQYPPNLILQQASSQAGCGFLHLLLHRKHISMRWECIVWLQHISFKSVIHLIFLFPYMIRKAPSSSRNQMAVVVW